MDVLVPYGEGRNLREALIGASQRYDNTETAALLRQAKPYAVSLPRGDFQAMQEKGALIALLDGNAFALADGFYDGQTGFVREAQICTI